jgi:hypothetical protein
MPNNTAKFLKVSENCAWEFNLNEAHFYVEAFGFHNVVWTEIPEHERVDMFNLVAPGKKGYT